MPLTILPPHRVAAEWPRLEQLLAPAIAHDEKRNSAEVFAELMSGKLRLYDIDILGARGVAVTEIGISTGGVCCCWIVYIGGAISGPPRMWRRRVRLLLGFFERQARHAGCAEMRLEGRDWHSILTDYERLAERAGRNELRKALPMGGSNTQTTTSSTAPSNPAVNTSVNKLLGGINAAYDAGPKVFNQSLYAGVGPTTTNAWNAALGIAANPDYASGINGAIKSYGDVAAGHALGQNDPGYVALRAKLANDVVTSTNSSFNNSGLFGSDTNQQAAAQGLTNGLGALDYQQYQDSLNRQNAASALLPQLYQAGLMPSTTQGAIGAAQDANAQGTLSGQGDLFDRTNNANVDLLAKLSAILTGTSATAGTTTTTTAPATPWWQTALGIVAPIVGRGLFP